MENLDLYEMVVYYDGDAITSSVHLENNISDRTALLACKGILYNEAWVQVDYIIRKNKKYWYSENALGYPVKDPEKHFGEFVDDFTLDSE